MLRAIAQLLRPGGRMAFFTIYVAAGLSPEQMQRAEKVGPSAVGAPGDHVDLLRAAGFTGIAERDLTADFIETTKSWLRELDAHAEELAPLQPAGAFEERQRERRAMLAATEDGLLRRALYLARR